MAVPAILFIFLLSGSKSKKKDELRLCIVLIYKKMYLQKINFIIWKGRGIFQRRTKDSYELFFPS